MKIGLFTKQANEHYPTDGYIIVVEANSVAEALEKHAGSYDFGGQIKIEGEEI